jgi:tRNA 2-selenouridine synthase
MEFFGIKVSVLVGGYKSYRQHVRKTFDLTYNFSILGGMTGSGKTHILDELEKTSAFCIDLEKLAHHRGSSYGALGMEAQPSQEQFENNLAQQLIITGKNTVWLEDESRTIGAKIIPEGIWNQMRKAPHYFLDSSFDERLDQIMADYGNFSIEELKICTLRIAKRLGPQHAKKAIEYLDNNEVRNAFSIALSYYDKAYSYHKEINPLGEKIKIESPAKNYTEIANFLVNIKNGK